MVSSTMKTSSRNKRTANVSPLGSNKLVYMYVCVTVAIDVILCDAQVSGRHSQSVNGTVGVLCGPEVYRTLDLFDCYKLSSKTLSSRR